MWLGALCGSATWNRDVVHCSFAKRGGGSSASICLLLTLYCIAQRIKADSPSNTTTTFSYNAVARACMLLLTGQRGGGPMQKLVHACCCSLAKGGGKCSHWCMHVAAHWPKGGETNAKASAGMLLLTWRTATNPVLHCNTATEVSHTDITTRRFQTTLACCCCCCHSCQGLTAAAR